MGVHDSPLPVAHTPAGALPKAAKRLLVIAPLCYALLILAWILDLFTPQSFVAAILLNGPIALSALALRKQLTLQLTILAEIANVVAGYVNGLQAGGHWDAIALGDRAISAATFVLVGVLTVHAHESARRAGESEERRRGIERERALRHAMEIVRASLNFELVLRSAVREAERLTGAEHVALIVRNSALDVPDTYESRAGAEDVDLRRAPLAPELASLIERARDEEAFVTVDSKDPLGRLLGENAFVAAFPIDTAQVALLVGWGNRTPTEEDRSSVRAFVANLAVALRQARMFIRLAEQNEQIARQKDELQGRNDVIRDIVYALAHDLRTPLAAADLTMTQALEGAYGELPQRYREILRTAISSNVDLRRLVETLLLVARYESGEDSQLRTAEPVLPLVSRVANELRPIAEVKGVSLTVDPQSRPSTVLVDPDELRRAITNLVANAIEATPSSGHVNVGVSDLDGRVVIEVVDDGYGVPPAKRLGLFQRFSGVRTGGGTALGLYIVRRIAEKYGGAAGYEPRDKGSRFFLALPKVTNV